MPRVNISVHECINFLNVMKQNVKYRTGGKSTMITTLIGKTAAVTYRLNQK